MAKKSSPLAGMMSKAVSPPFIGGVATPIPKGPKATPGKAPGVGRGNMANFKGKHAAPFQKKS